MDFELKLDHVEDAYIEFLKRYQIEIMPNKKEKRRHRRLYFCITIQETLYAIPLCSPKETDYYRSQAKKDCISIIRLVDKNTDLLGTLRLSHMIVVPTNAMRYYDINKERDIRYKELVTKEYKILKSKQNRIRKNALVLIKQKSHEDDYFLYSNQEAPNYILRTLDFKFVKEMILEYAPGLNYNYGVEIINDDDIISENIVEKPYDDMGFIMLDKVGAKPEFRKKYDDVEEEKFNLEDEMKNLRKMVSDAKNEEVKVEPIKEVKEKILPKEEIKPVIEEPKEHLEVKSTKAILLALRSIHSGRSDVDILLNSCFKYREVVYQILQYDYKTLYALLKNCKTNEIILVSNFPKDDQCGWERPVKFGNQEDSYKRGIKIYNGFIK